MPSMSIRELSKLNRTSSQLYRVLLRSIIKCHKEQQQQQQHDFSHVYKSCYPINEKDIIECKQDDASRSPKTSDSRRNTLASMGKSFILLQPPLQPKDYGLARSLRSDNYLLWTPSLHRKLPDERGREKVIIDNIINFFRQSITPDEPQDTQHQEPVESTTQRIHADHSVLFVSCKDLVNALRQSFWRLAPDSYNSKKDNNTISVDKRRILHMHRQAIETVSLLDEQVQQYIRSTSISCDWERGIRIIVTSKCIGGGGSNPTHTNSTQCTLHAMKHPAREWKYRFAYRIRVEKFSTEHKHEKHQTTVQLLGRSWFIVEHPPDNDNDDRKQQALHDFWYNIENSVIHEKKSNTLPDMMNKQQLLEIVTVQAPTTGVVGHLPVLKDGHLFEYMSGCEISTKSGSMGGCFHFAIVDDDTESGYVGDPIEAFQSGEEEEKFRILIRPFSLVVE